MYIFSKKLGGTVPPIVCNIGGYYFSDSHFWFATVQEVLQADWQELWHLPQPPFTAEAFRLALLMVVMCFKSDTSFVIDCRVFSCDY